MAPGSGSPSVSWTTPVTQSVRVTGLSAFQVLKWATSAVMVSLLFVEGRRVQAGLRSALEEERLIAAKISTELAVAAEIHVDAALLGSRADAVRFCQNPDDPAHPLNRGWRAEVAGKLARNALKPEGNLL